MIYFTRDEATQFIKIGFTAGDGEGRMRTLQTGCPGTLVLLLEIEGSKQDEKAWHDRFAPAWVRGEWFQPVPELLLAIAEQRISQIEMEKDQLQERLNAERERLSVARDQLHGLWISLGLPMPNRPVTKHTERRSPLEQEKDRLEAHLAAERGSKTSLKIAIRNIMTMLEGVAELPVKRAVIYGHSGESAV